jgi:hypothetical protein
LSISKERKHTLIEAFMRLPLTFIPNAGQTHEKVKYYIHSSGRAFYFTREEAEFRFWNLASPVRRMNLGLQFVGANSDVELEGQHESEGKVNYFIGNDPTKWITNLPTYHEVVYRDLWPGVDLHFKEENGRLKYEFFVKPGANTADIRLRYRGVEQLSLDDEGNLEIHTPYGILLDERPVSMQEVEGKQSSVSSSYLLQKGDGGEWEYTFQLGCEFDPRYPLIIDPGLFYSTYLGGSGFESGIGIAVDSSGSAYVAGFTDSPNFPTQHPFQAALAGGFDAFVTKFSPAGNTLIYSTYLGGSGLDVGEGIAVDSMRAAYVTGFTNSPNFPTQNPFQAALAGGDDAFVTKLSPAGNSLVYSTYLGGTGNDVAEGIAIDSSGSAYIIGQTGSTNFPTQNPFQATLAGGEDIFVTKFSPSGNALVYSTYLGGSGLDSGVGITVDSSRSAYVTGLTNSLNFPTQNPFQATFAGGPTDAFVTKFSPAGNTLVYSTYLGGSDDDEGHAIAVDRSGSAYVTGQTFSPDFPTLNPFQVSLNGPEDAFVTKFSPSGNMLVYSTYLGGSSFDGGNGIAVDSAGSALVTGATSSTDFPTLDAFQPTYGGGFNDAFVTKLSPAGNTLIYSSYLGGSGDDSTLGIAIDRTGAAYVTGSTDSSNFPAVNPFQAAFAGGFGDAFVTKI